jgi:tripartite-type tricarboxylate transporter receptor subunit TctC
MLPLIRALATLLLIIGLPLPASAQPYPNRAIKMILPFPAGSATDGIARYIAEELRKSLGQPVIIENQAGADGNLAAQNVKRSEPDGYTIFLTTNSTHAVNPTLYKQLPYDPEKDFEPISGVMRILQMMCVRKDFPTEDLAGFIRVAKERAATKPLTYGSGNTSSRVASELLKASANIEMTHVPYRGTPQAITDLLGGQIDMFFADPFAGVSLVNEGQLKVLAVTDTRRLPLLPEVPTMAEAGYKEVEIVSWAAMFVPAKTNPVIVDRLNKEVNEILKKPEATEYLQKMGATPMPTTSSELRSFVTSEIARWARFLDIADIPKK